MAQLQIDCDDLNHIISDEYLNDDVQYELTKEVRSIVRKKLKPLIVKRAVIKRKLTLALKNIQNYVDISEVESSVIMSHIDNVNKLLDDLDKSNTCILEVYYDNEYYNTSRLVYEREIECQMSYLNGIMCKVGHYKHVAKSLDEKINASISAINQSAAHNKESISNSNFSKIKPPRITCSKFNGHADQNFVNFWRTFECAIGSNDSLNDLDKFIYLKSFLGNPALKLIESLSIASDSYKLAYQLLKSEYFDEEFQIDSLLKRLLSLDFGNCTSYDSLRDVLNTFKSHITELCTFNLDFVNENAGSKLLSHIVFSKMPRAFNVELTREINNSYPTLEQLLSKSTEVIRKLQRNNVYLGSKAKYAPNTRFIQKKPISENSKNSFVRPDFKRVNNPSLVNLYQTPLKNDIKSCKFCSGKHQLYLCQDYKSLDERMKRCDELRLCKKCLSNKHNTENCPAIKYGLSFKCYHCGKNDHISAMCKDFLSRKNTVNINLCLSSNDNKSQQYITPVMDMHLSKGRKAYKVAGIIDTGSCRSFVTGKFAKALDIEFERSSKQYYDIKTLFGKNTKELAETAITINFGNNIEHTLPVLIDQTLNLDYSCKGMSSAIKNLKNSGFSLASDSFLNAKDDLVKEIHMLIGSDILQYFPVLELIKIRNHGSGFHIGNNIVTPFGDVRNFLNDHEIRELIIRRDRPIMESHSNQEIVLNRIMEPKAHYFDPYKATSVDCDVETGLQNLYKLESLGISDSDFNKTFDESVHKEFIDGIEYHNGRYHVKLPWKTNLINKVPSNSDIALKAVHRLVKNLNDKGIYEHYDTYLDEMEKSDMIRQFVVNPDQYKKFSWLTHREVHKPSSTTSKYRPVWNASLSINGAVSINEASYSGINLLKNLVTMLMHFRCNRYCILSDIKRAYLQIRLKDEFDRRKLCFFWIKNNEIKCYKFNSILFGLSSSQYVLLAVILFHVQKYPQDIYSTILKDHLYSDNLIFTNNDLQVLHDAQKTCSERLGEAKMELTQWQTNSHELYQKFISDQVTTVDFSDITKILGYKYSTINDTLQISDSILGDNAKTKREIVSQYGSIFDPIGLYLPVSVSGKIIIRNLWLQGYSWDEELPSNLQQQWIDFAREMNQAKTNSFSRCSILTDSSESTITLNIFTDASMNAYSCCFYVQSDIGSNLILSKSKIAPNKNFTIPIMELLGVFLAYKMLPEVLENLISSFKISGINIFVDSQLVINWLLKRNVQVKRLFTRNRIKNIQTFKKDIIIKYGIKISYYYVSTENNPSDLITRGIPAKQFRDKMSFYTHGPNWLSQEKQFWPKHPLKSVTNEIKNSCEFIGQCLATDVVVNRDGNESVIDIYKFSDYNKLIRITKLLYDFIYISKGDSNANTTNLAHQYWITFTQNSYFSEEIKFLKKYQNEKFGSHIKIPHLVDRLNLFLDEKGSLRSKGRISKANFFDINVHNPLILPKNAYFTKLFIKHIHISLSHLGIGTVLAQIRLKGIWILKARQTIKSVLADCIICRKFNNLAFRYPKLTSFSSLSMNFCTPWSYTGLDFTGTIYLTDENNQSSKFYILIYTCMTLRSIYLDLVPSMSAKHVLYSFKRFCNRYCTPRQIFSDNFTSFVQVGKMLEEALHSDYFKSFLISANIKHIKIPIRASWVGSAYESIVRITKRSLYKIVGRKKLNYFEMLTVLSSIENCVNSRPLTYMHSENDDFKLLSPNSFLKLYSNSQLLLKCENEQSYTDFNPTTTELEKYLLHMHELYSDLKDDWKNNYLLSLREQSRLLFQSSFENRMKIGDIVIIKTEQKSKPFWPMAKIVKLNYGDDGCVRSVYLIKNANEPPQLHPVSHLFPLEINVFFPRTGENINTQTRNLENFKAPVATQNSNSTNANKQNNLDVNRLTHNDRPKRTAAIKCREFIRQQSPYL